MTLTGPHLVSNCFHATRLAKLVENIQHINNQPSRRSAGTGRSSPINSFAIQEILNEETACGEPDLDVGESDELTSMPRHLSYIRGGTNLQGYKELLQRACYEILLLQK